MIGLAAKIVGHEETAVRLESAGARMRAALVRAVRESAIEMQGIVKEEYLSGPRPEHLGVKTGRLRRSVNVMVSDSGDSVTGSVGTNVDYGRAWELGFSVPARDIFAKPGKALFWPGARHPVKHVHQDARTVAARPFLAPALRDEAPRFHERVRRAVLGGF